VHLFDGTKKRIDAIAVNELVMSMDTLQKNKRSARVTGISQFDAHEVVELSFADGSRLRATLPHPFFTPSGTRVRASELAAGDRLLCLDGTVEVKATQRVKGRARAYMLALDGGDNFFAGGITALGGVVKDF
jgi:hypothetical protein